eukprot:scaffold213003_cov31-Tisochrysis_lutea.AAC.1
MANRAFAISELGAFNLCTSIVIVIVGGATRAYSAKHARACTWMTHAAANFFFAAASRNSSSLTRSLIRKRTAGTTRSSSDSNHIKSRPAVPCSSVVLAPTLFPASIGRPTKNGQSHCHGSSCCAWLRRAAQQWSCFRNSTRWHARSAPGRAPMSGSSAESVSSLHISASARTVWIRRSGVEARTAS